jgi:hypothetical protein
MNIDIDNIATNRVTIIKYSIVVILVVIVYFVVRKAIKKMKADAAALKLKKEIISTDLSYPLNEYVNMADTLDYAMNGAGTDEDKVYAVFNKLNNISDALQLSQTFGIRKYSSGWTFGLFTDDYNLTQFIQADFSASGIQKINNILLSKGINLSY